MATIEYLKSRNRWRIRWHITCPKTGKKNVGSKTLPAGSDRKQAENVLASITATQQAIKNPLGGVTLAQAVNDWLLSISSLAVRTRGHYSCVLTHFCQQAGDMPLKSLSPAHVRDYLTSMLQADKTARTCNAHLTAIKSFSRWAAEAHQLSSAAAAVAMLKEAPPKQRFLSAAEYQAIIDMMPPVVRSWFVFLANTGLRASEFCNLRHTDIAADNQTLSFIGKGNKRRVVPLNSVCREILTQTERSTSLYIFTKNTRQFDCCQPISRKYLLYCCAVANRRLRLAPFGPHAFRHLFATQLVLSGIPLNIAARILGHSSSRTTEKVYLHIVNQDLIGTTENLY